MGFVMLFAAAWATILLFYGIRHRLTILENAFVYLLGMTLVIHGEWVICAELKLIAETKEGLLYAGLIGYRLVILPMALVLMVNGIARARTTGRAFLSIAAALGGLLAVRGIMQFYEVIQYKRWNIYYDAMFILLLQAVCLGALKLYRTLLRREVNAA